MDTLISKEYERYEKKLKSDKMLQKNRLKA